MPICLFCHALCLTKIGSKYMQKMHPPADCHINFVNLHDSPLMLLRFQRPLATG